jgi:hypothetical protein
VSHALTHPRSSSTAAASSLARNQFRSSNGWMTAIDGVLCSSNSGDGYGVWTSMYLHTSQVPHLCSVRARYKNGTSVTQPSSALLTPARSLSDVHHQPICSSMGPINGSSAKIGPVGASQACFRSHSIYIFLDKKSNRRLAAAPLRAAGPGPHQPPRASVWAQLRPSSGGRAPAPTTWHLAPPAPRPAGGSFQEHNQAWHDRVLCRRPNNHRLLCPPPPPPRGPRGWSDSVVPGRWFLVWV